jgi:hypothetical protein
MADQLPLHRTIQVFGGTKNLPFVFTPQVGLPIIEFANIFFNGVQFLAYQRYFETPFPLGVFAPPIGPLLELRVGFVVTNLAVVCDGPEMSLHSTSTPDYIY